MTLRSILVLTMTALATTAALGFRPGSAGYVATWLGESVSGAPTIPTNGLIAEFLFDDEDATDSYGNVAMVTNAGTVTYADGYINVGPTSYLQSTNTLATINNATTNYPFSYSAWFYKDPLQTGFQTIMDTGSATPGTENFMLGVGFTAISNRFTTLHRNNTANKFNTSTNLTFSGGTWNHVVAVWTTNSYDIYLNNQLDMQITTSLEAVAPEAGWKLRIGSWGAGNVFSGRLDAVRFYHSELSTDDINALYEATRQ